MRRTAVGESDGAGVGIKIGASVGVTMGVLVGSGATSAKSAGGLRSSSILTETACASYCASCIWCKRSKSNLTSRMGLLQSFERNLPNDDIALDILTFK